MVADRFEHPSMEPEGLMALLKWLYDGYGGHLSEQARGLIFSQIETLEAESNG